MQVKTVTPNLPGVGSVNIMYALPDNFIQGSRLSAFIFFPGKGESGSDPSKLYVNGPLNFVKSGWEAPFMLIGVQTRDPWGPDPNAKPTFVQAALDWIFANLPINQNQWYLTGLSYGAAYIGQYMQLQDAATFHKPAAAIPMSMGIYKNVGDFTRFAKIPMFGSCGDKDDWYTPNMQFYKDLTAAGYPNLFLTRVGLPHCCWNDIYNPKFIIPGTGLTMYEWALQYNNNVAVTPPPPPPVTKVIKSVTINYTDGTSETKP